MDDSSERAIGKHRIRFTPPYIFFGKLVEDVSGDEMTEIVGYITEFAANKPGVLAIFDVTSAGTLLPGSRRPVMQVGPYLRGSAIIGASRHMEIAATLLSRAFALVKRESDNPIAFFHDEQQAREWIAERELLLPK